MESCVDTILQDPGRRVRIKPGYAVRAFVDEYLVIPVESPGAEDSKMAVLSPVAEFIWRLLEVPRAFDEILGAVVDEFDVTADIAKSDVIDYLYELERYRFLLMEDEEV